MSISSDLDPVKQADLVKEAVASRVDGIIVDHGTVDAMTPVVERAIFSDVGVVTFELKLDEVEGDVEVDQDNLEAGRRILQAAVTGSGTSFKYAYINVEGPEG